MCRILFKAIVLAVLVMLLHRCKNFLGFGYIVASVRKFPAPMQQYNQNCMYGYTKSTRGIKPQQLSQLRDIPARNGCESSSGVILTFFPGKLSVLDGPHFLFSTFSHFRQLLRFIECTTFNRSTVTKQMSERHKH